MAAPISVVESLCEDIREQILRGKYKPGTVLRQQELAQAFDVSRVPLREAFSKLEAEGYLILRPRRGYAVSSLNPEEVSEIFDLRMLIESHAGQLATRNRTQQDVAEVTALVEAMEALPEDAPNYVDKWCDLNRAFHERLVRSCGRPRLLKLFLQLRDTVEPYIRLESTMTGHSSEPSNDHREILAAFVAGKADLVGTLSAVHCSRTSERLLASLEARAKAEGTTGAGHAYGEDVVVPEVSVEAVGKPAVKPVARAAKPAKPARTTRQRT